MYYAVEGGDGGELELAGKERRGLGRRGVSRETRPVPVAREDHEAVVVPAGRLRAAD